MKQKLQSRLLNYFMLIAVAAMLIGVEFYFEMSHGQVNQEICSLAAEDSTGKTLPLGNLRNKVVIMFGMLTVVVAIVLTMFIRNITTPLQKMADVAAGINAGDLSLTVPVETHDEIGQVGNAINELTSNLQEVASMTSTTAGDILAQIDALLASHNIGEDRAGEIRTGLRSLMEFVDSFKLLRTDIP